MNRSASDLGNMLKHLRHARHYAESIKREKTTGPETRHRLNGVTNRINAAEREMLDGLPAASKSVLESQILDVEITTQIEAINEHLLAMNQHGRDIAEKYIESLRKINTPI